MQQVYREKMDPDQIQPKAELLKTQYHQNQVTSFSRHRVQFPILQGRLLNQFHWQNFLKLNPVYLLPILNY